MRFEKQPNALNLIRLVLATAVIVWHTADISTPAPSLPFPVEQLLGWLPVDAFFALSGFLIARSWCHSPQLCRYLLARATRLFPGMWACLLLIAFVVAPLATWGADLPQPAFDAKMKYVLGNASTFITEWRIGDSLERAPSVAWNGPLWTLWWEACCYFVLAILGSAGLLRSRHVVAIASGLWASYLAVTVTEIVPPEITMHPLLAAPRLGLMFATGVLFWLHRDRITVDHRLAGVSALLIAAASFVPSYQLIAAPAVAYLCLWAALALGRYQVSVLRNDFSYGVYIYGWPVQQALLLLGLSGTWSVLAFASFAAALPLAVVSWFLVERPAMRWRRRRTVEADVGVKPLVSYGVAARGI